MKAVDHLPEAAVYIEWNKKIVYGTRRTRGLCVAFLWCIFEPGADRRELTYDWAFLWRVRSTDTPFRTSVFGERDGEIGGIDHMLHTSVILSFSEAVVLDRQAQSSLF